MNPDPRKLIEALRGSHERLAALAAGLTPGQLRVQSYDTEWTIAQLLSHLGSGAQIAQLMLPAALGRAAQPDMTAFQQVWDRWNAKDPDAQAADALAADGQYVADLEQLSDADLAAVSLDFLGMTLDAAGLIRLRLSEHALHTWDLAVFTDPAAAVDPAAVELLIDNVAGFIAPRAGRPQDPPFQARITTTDPGRDLLLVAGPQQVTVTDWAGAPAGTDEVAMPAEALLRLAYGRLDAAHTPPHVTGSSTVLDQLRAVFPGF